MSIAKHVTIGVLLLAIELLCVRAPALADAADASAGSNAAAPSASQQIFSYLNAAGRVVYVNDRSRIPLRYRKRAKPVDLSRVSLNTKLGNDLDDAIEREYLALISSEPCEKARRTAAGGWSGRLWRDHGHLVLIAAALLALLVLTPWMSRRIGAPQWGRTLMFVIPLLLSVGLLAHSAVKTSQAMREVRATAAVCRADPRRKEGPLNRLDALQRLRSRLEVVGNTPDRLLRERM